MLPDTRIVQHHGPHTVLAQRLVVQWPDCSVVGLHPVRLRGRDDRYLRALQNDPLLWLVVDVRDLVPSLATEIPALPWRDTEGLVLHSLRLGYRNAGALLARAAARCKSSWTAAPDAGLCQGVAQPTRLQHVGVPQAAGQKAPEVVA